VDSLFESKPEEERHSEQSFALAAVAGRTGGDSANLTEAYRPQLRALDKILAGCGKTFPAVNASRVSIMDAPAGKTQGDSRRALLPGPLALSSTLTENLLLEFAEGMNGAELGWGCLDAPPLRHVMQLHTAATEYAKRTPAIARTGAANLLGANVDALQQSATGKVVAGAPGKPGGRVLFLVGHDTNIAMVSGVLHLNWVIDGRADDPPPGGSLVFELWRAHNGGAYSVRIYYTAQTLQQMRTAKTLTAADPPQRVPVFVPGCSNEHMACTLDDFAADVKNALAQR
jgi:4-phytase/acid phosphatase